MENLLIWFLKMVIVLGFVSVGEYWLKGNADLWQYLIVYIVGYMLMDLWGYLKYESK